MGKETIIEIFDPKPAIKKNAESARDWEFSEDARFLYGIAVIFRDRLIDPIARIDRSQMPDPVISFDDLRNNKTLAAYTISRNAQGLLDEITFNTAHYDEKDGQMIWKFGRWAQLETLLHEQIHLWQQRVGNNPVKPGRSHHNKEFLDKCESLGLHPMPNIGCHIAVADGVFAQLMAEMGVERPADVPREKGKKLDWFKPEKEKGRSTLHKWVCPDCGLSVRIGIKSDPRLVHDLCSELRGEKVFLVQHDGLTHTIFNGEGAKEKPESPTPQIISEINKSLKAISPEGLKEHTVEGIAQKIGISKTILYEWVQTDAEFSAALERIKTIQHDDPFRTGTIEHGRVNAMVVAFDLLETRDRHYNRHDIYN